MIKYGRGAAAQVDHLVPARTNRGTKKLPTSPLPPITAMRTVMILAGLALRRGVLLRASTCQPRRMTNAMITTTCEYERGGRGADDHRRPSKRRSNGRNAT